jgi:hypothetical protein
MFDYSGSPNRQHTKPPIRQRTACQFPVISLKHRRSKVIAVRTKLLVANAAAAAYPNHWDDVTSPAWYGIKLPHNLDFISRLLAPTSCRCL